MATGTETCQPAASNLPKIRRSEYLLAAVLVGIVLYLPYLIPQHPTASDSYIFGYNNRAGVVLLILSCAFVAIWKKGFQLPLLPAAKSEKIPARTVATCLVIQLILCLSMIWITAGTGGFRESNYVIDRVWLLSQGHVPYRAFEWPFGVLWLYGPLWLARILRVSLVLGYDIFWTVASVAGVALLALTINRIDYPSPRKRSAFLLLFATVLPATLGMGAHYTLLRYLPPFYFMLLVHGVSTARSHDVSRLAGFLSICFAGVLLLISPEMAVAFCFGCIVLLIPYDASRNLAAIGGVAYVAMLLGFGMLFVVAYKLHVLDTLIASGGGADSFPIPFSAPVLFFFGVVFICACALVRRYADCRVGDNSSVLIVVSAPLLAAALGRCDSGHILANGIGLFIAAGFYASVSERWWVRYRNGVLGAMVLTALPVLIWTVLPQIGALATRAWKKQSGSVLIPVQLDFFSIYPHLRAAQADNVLGAPFGYTPNGLSSYLSKQVDLGFYEGLENANTPRAVQRKISELSAEPRRMLLLPEQFENDCRVNAKLERIIISVLFSFPYMARVSHPVSVRQPLCAYIDAHYVLADPAGVANYGYGLWAPN